MRFQGIIEMNPVSSLYTALEVRIDYVPGGQDAGYVFWRQRYPRKNLEGVERRVQEYFNLARVDYRLGGHEEEMCPMRAVVDTRDMPYPPDLEFRPSNIPSIEALAELCSRLIGLIPAGRRSLAVYANDYDRRVVTGQQLLE